jgi:transcriptional regulator GlxA family with amidase domain
MDASPSETFTNLRLRKAAHGLRYRRKHVADISLDCGFFHQLRAAFEQRLATVSMWGGFLFLRSLRCRNFAWAGV